MSARVLIVEDNPMNRELMDYLLRAFGFETLNAADGRIGLDMARRERPDLILCDIQMPHVDGHEFARQAKADPDLRTIPLIAVTAFAMVGDRDEMLAQGFDGYISKPIEPLSLVASVNEALPAHLRAQLGAAQPAQAPSATVLVLDDAPVNLELKRDLLQPHGYRVLTAETLAEALHLAQVHLPDLILSDVGMPQGSGFDFIRAVKADPRLREIPFVFLSATHWNDAARNEGLTLGAVRYLLRPLEPAALLAEIEACLQRNP